MTSTLEIQRALTALGYDPGPLDGIRGRLTIRAVKAFQADHALAAALSGRLPGLSCLEWSIPDQRRSLPAPPLRRAAAGMT